MHRHWDVRFEGSFNGQMVEGRAALRTDYPMTTEAAKAAITDVPDTDLHPGFLIILDIEEVEEDAFHDLQQSLNPPSI